MWSTRTAQVRWVSNCSRTAGIWNSTGAATACGSWKANTSTIEVDGKTVEIADERHYGQRLHDGLEDVCVRLLQLAERPAVGGTPASVIVTIGVEELLAKAGIADTSDGTQLSANQLLRIADEAEIWPPSSTATGCRWR